MKYYKQLHYGYTMTTLWLYYDCTMIMPWLHYDHTMTILWLQYDYTMTALWLYYDYTMTSLWLYYYYAIAMLWLHYGHTEVLFVNYCFYNNRLCVFVSWRLHACRNGKFYMVFSRRLSATSDDNLRDKTV